MTAKDNVYTVLERLESDPPIAARQICVETLQFVRSAVGEKEDERTALLVSEFIDTWMENQTNPSDLSGVMSSEIFTGFDFPADIESWEKIVEVLYSNPKFAAFGNNIQTVDETILAAIMAAPLLMGVMFIKFREEELLTRKPRPNYRQTMTALDGELHLLYRLNLLLQTIIPALKAGAEKIVRIEGAKRGGREKRDKFMNLKKAVLSEHDQFHTKKTPTRAGLDIYERIRVHDSLKEELTDENLKPLSTNPPPLFAKWIRAHRQKKTLRNSP